MNNSFKFIVNPNYTYEIEITSFLQYCALKNTLSEFNSNNIKPLKNNRNPVSFSNKITNIESNVSFTKYIQMERDEKDAFKTKIFKEEGVNLFFDAISDSLYSGLCKNRVFLDLFHYDDPDYQTVNDLYKFFTSGISAEYYLSKYIPKNSKEVCYQKKLSYQFTSYVFNLIISLPKCKVNNKNCKKYCNLCIFVL